MSKLPGSAAEKPRKEDPLKTLIDAHPTASAIAARQYVLQQQQQQQQHSHLSQPPDDDFEDDDDDDSKKRIRQKERLEKEDVVLDALEFEVVSPSALKQDAAGRVPEDDVDSRIARGYGNLSGTYSSGRGGLNRSRAGHKGSFVGTGNIEEPFEEGSIASGLDDDDEDEDEDDDHEPSPEFLSRRLASTLNKSSVVAGVRDTRISVSGRSSGGGGGPVAAAETNSARKILNTNQQILSVITTFAHHFLPWYLLVLAMMAPCLATAPLAVLFVLLVGTSDAVITDSRSGAAAINILRMRRVLTFAAIVVLLANAALFAAGLGGDGDDGSAFTAIHHLVARWDDNLLSVVLWCGIFMMGAALGTVACMDLGKLDSDFSWPTTATPLFVACVVLRVANPTWVMFCLNVALAFLMGSLLGTLILVVALASFAFSLYARRKQETTAAKMKVEAKKKMKNNNKPTTGAAAGAAAASSSTTGYGGVGNSNSNNNNTNIPIVASTYSDDDDDSSDSSSSNSSNSSSSNSNSSDENDENAQRKRQMIRNASFRVERKLEETHSIYVRTAALLLNGFVIIVTIAASEIVGWIQHPSDQQPPPYSEHAPYLIALLLRSKNSFVAPVYSIAAISYYLCCVWALDDLSSAAAAADGDTLLGAKKKSFVAAVAAAAAGKQQQQPGAATKGLLVRPSSAAAAPFNYGTATSSSSNRNIVDVSSPQAVKPTLGDSMRNRRSRNDVIDNNNNDDGAQHHHRRDDTEEKEEEGEEELRRLEMSVHDGVGQSVVAPSSLDYAEVVRTVFARFLRSIFSIWNATLLFFVFIVGFSFVGIGWVVVWLFAIVLPPFRKLSIAIAACAVLHLAALHIQQLEGVGPEWFVFAQPSNQSRIAGTTTATTTTMMPLSHNITTTSTSTSTTTTTTTTTTTDDGTFTTMPNTTTSFVTYAPYSPPLQSISAATIVGATHGWIVGLLILVVLSNSAWSVLGHDESNFSSSSPSADLKKNRKKKQQQQRQQAMLLKNDKHNSSSDTNTLLNQSTKNSKTTSTIDEEDPSVAVIVLNKVDQTIQLLLSLGRRYFYVASFVLLMIILFNVHAIHVLLMFLSAGILLVRSQLQATLWTMLCLYSAALAVAMYAVDLLASRTSPLPGYGFLVQQSPWLLTFHFVCCASFLTQMSLMRSEARQYWSWTAAAAAQQKKQEQHQQQQQQLHRASQLAFGDEEQEGDDDTTSGAGRERAALLGDHKKQHRKSGGAGRNRSTSVVIENHRDDDEDSDDDDADNRNNGGGGADGTTAKKKRRKRKKFLYIYEDPENQQNWSWISYVPIVERTCAGAITVVNLTLLAVNAGQHEANMVGFTFLIAFLLLTTCIMYTSATRPPNFVRTLWSHVTVLLLALVAAIYLFQVCPPEWQSSFEQILPEGCTLGLLGFAQYVETRSLVPLLLPIASVMGLAVQVRAWIEVASAGGGGSTASDKAGKTTMPGRGNGSGQSLDTVPGGSEAQLVKKNDPASSAELTTAAAAATSSVAADEQDKKDNKLLNGLDPESVLGRAVTLVSHLVDLLQSFVIVLAVLTMICAAALDVNPLTTFYAISALLLSIFRSCRESRWLWRTIQLYAALVALAVYLAQLVHFLPTAAQAQESTYAGIPLLFIPGGIMPRLFAHLCVYTVVAFCGAPSDEDRLSDDGAAHNVFFFSMPNRREHEDKSGGAMLDGNNNGDGQGQMSSSNFTQDGNSNRRFHETFASAMAEQTHQAAAAAARSKPSRKQQQEAGDLEGGIVADEQQRLLEDDRQKKSGGEKPGLLSRILKNPLRYYRRLGFHVTMILLIFNTYLQRNNMAGIVYLGVLCVIGSIGRRHMSVGVSTNVLCLVFMLLVIVEYVTLLGLPPSTDGFYRPNETVAKNDSATTTTTTHPAFYFDSTAAMMYNASNFSGNGTGSNSTSGSFWNSTYVKIGTRTSLLLALCLLGSACLTRAANISVGADPVLGFAAPTSLSVGERIIHFREKIDVARVTFAHNWMLRLIPLPAGREDFTRDLGSWTSRIRLRIYVTLPVLVLMFVFTYCVYDATNSLSFAKLVLLAVTLWFLQFSQELLWKGNWWWKWMLRFHMMLEIVRLLYLAPVKIPGGAAFDLVHIAQPVDSKYGPFWEYPLTDAIFHYAILMLLWLQASCFERVEYAFVLHYLFRMSQIGDTVANILRRRRLEHIVENQHQLTKDWEELQKVVADLEVQCKRGFLAAMLKIHDVGYDVLQQRQEAEGQGQGEHGGKGGGEMIRVGSSSTSPIVVVVPAQQQQTEQRQLSTTSFLSSSSGAADNRATSAAAAAAAIAPRTTTVSPTLSSTNLKKQATTATAVEQQQQQKGGASESSAAAAGGDDESQPAQDCGSGLELYVRRITRWLIRSSLFDEPTWNAVSNTVVAYYDQHNKKKPAYNTVSTYNYHKKKNLMTIEQQLPHDDDDELLHRQQQQQQNDRKKKDAAADDDDVSTQVKNDSIASALTKDDRAALREDKNAQPIPRVRVSRMGSSAVGIPPPSPAAASTAALASSAAAAAAFSAAIGDYQAVLGHEDSVLVKPSPDGGAAAAAAISASGTEKEQQKKAGAGVGASAEDPTEEHGEDDGDDAAALPPAGEFFIAVFYYAASYLDVACYMCFSLQFALAPCLANLTLPVLSFCYAAVMNPRPHYMFWNVALIYLQIAIVAKSLVKVFECEHGEYSVWTGRICVAGGYYFVTDLFVSLISVVCMLFHKANLVAWGLFHNADLDISRVREEIAECDAEIMLQKQQKKAATAAASANGNGGKTPPVRAATATAADGGINNNNNNAATAIALPPSSPSSQLGFRPPKPSELHTGDAAVHPLSVAGMSSEVRTFFRQCVENVISSRDCKPGGDTYSTAVAAEMLSIFILFFGYFKLMGQEDSIVNSLSGSLLPGTLTISVFLLVFMVVLDRIVFMRRSHGLKYALTVAAMLLYSGVMLAWFNDQQSYDRSYYGSDPYWLRGALPLAAALYLLKMFYIFLSCRQIALGLPRIESHICFTGTCSLVEQIKYILSRVTPFAFDLRVLLDWTVTNTTLKLAWWIRMEDIAHELYMTKCDVDDTKDLNAMKKNPKEDPFPRWLKYIIGAAVFALVAFVLLGPLLLYSGVSPVVQQNAVSEVSIVVSLPNLPPLWTTQQAVDGGVLNRTVISLLEKTRQSLLGLGFSGTNTVQFLQLTTFSSIVWTVSEEQVKSITQQLLLRRDSIALTTDISIQSHSSTTRSAAGGGSRILSQRRVLTNAEVRQFVDMLTGRADSVTIESMIQPFLSNRGTEFEAVAKDNSITCSLIRHGGRNRTNENPTNGTGHDGNHTDNETNTTTTTTTTTTTSTTTTSTTTTSTSTTSTTSGTTYPNETFTSGPSTSTTPTTTTTTTTEPPVTPSPNGTNNHSTPAPPPSEWDVGVTSQFEIRCHTIFENSNPTTYTGWGDLSPAEWACVRGTAPCPNEEAGHGGRANQEGMFFVVESSPSLSVGFLQSIGIVAAYTTFVLAIGRVLRFIFSGMAFKVSMEALEDPEPLIRMVQLMYMARARDQFAVELRAYTTLLDTLRQSELLFRVTKKND